RLKSGVCGFWTGDQHHQNMIWSSARSLFIAKLDDFYRQTDVCNCTYIEFMALRFSGRKMVRAGAPIMTQSDADQTAAFAVQMPTTEPMTLVGTQWAMMPIFVVPGALLGDATFRYFFERTDVMRFVDYRFITIFEQNIRLAYTPILLGALVSFLFFILALRPSLSVED
ncbi:hypothetical protein ACOI1H_23820, partial [Loktanella sp. DJP18]|uniref:hypothetical protein n=1 Tax=Loktanella sp. DJP18 TaxID=3409788 RepID=UPI003BB6834C